MKVYLIIVMVVVLGACAGPAVPPDAVVTFEGGAVSAAEIEKLLLSATPARRLEQSADIVTSYRHAAREIALTRILFPDSRERESRLALWREELPAAYRAAVVRLWIEDRLTRPGVPLVPNDDEALSFYNANRERFRQPAGRLIYSIYRRQRDGEDQDDAMRILGDVYRRLQAGEPFEELAREFSDSETRSAGGRVGWVPRGLMAADVDRQVFALGAGEVSLPFPAAGGAMVVWVRDARDEKTFEFEDVRLEIGSLLRDQRIEDFLEAEAEDFDSPDGAVILDREALDDLEADGDGEAEVLRLGDVVLTLGQLLAQARQMAQADGNMKPVWPLYRRQVRLVILYQKAIASGFVDDPNVEERLDVVMSPSAARGLVVQDLDRRATERLAADDDAVNTYFAAHREKFRSPLLLHTKRLTIGIGDDPVAQARELEEAREAVERGEISLEQVAEHFSGEIADLGWKAIDDLGELWVKERVYLLQLQGGGVTAPYHRSHSLCLLAVVGREEPHAQSLEEVREQVLSDLLKERINGLRDEVATEILEESGFVFHDERVRAILDLPSEDAAEAETS